MNVDPVQVGLALGAPALAREVHAPPPSPSAQRHNLQPSAASLIEVSDTARLLRGVLDALLLASVGNAGNAVQSRSQAQTAVLSAQSMLLPAQRATLTSQSLLDPTTALQSAPEMSARVRQVLEESGTFYEAHQGRWLQGQFDLSALRREPQARLASSIGAATPMTAPLATPAGRAIPTNAPPAPATLAPALERPGVAAAAADLARLPATADSAAVAPQREAVGSTSVAVPLTLPAPLAPILEQQMHYLTAGELSWRGEAWPGQEVHWCLSNDGGRASEDTAQARVWTTTLRMQLPQLGAVEAQLRVSDADIGLRLIGEPHALARLTAGMPQLAQSFESVGIALRSAQLLAHE